MRRPAGVLLAATVLLGGCADVPHMDVNLGGELDDCFVERLELDLDDPLPGFSAQDVVEQANRQQDGELTWADGESSDLEFPLEIVSEAVTANRLIPDVRQPKPVCDGLLTWMEVEVRVGLHTSDGRFDEDISALLTAVAQPDGPPLLSLESAPVEVQSLQGTWATPSSDSDLAIETLVFWVSFGEPFKLWEGGFVGMAHGRVIGQGRYDGETSSSSSCAEADSHCRRLVAWWRFDQ